MALTLVVRVPNAHSGEGATAEAPLPSITLDAPRLVLGRGEGCDLRLPDPSVSHRHASLRQRGSEWLLVDEKSTNGTVLGGVKLAPHSPRVVRSGELVRLGRVWIELRVEAAPPMMSQPAAAAKDLALELCTRALAAEGEDARPRVRVTAGPDTGKELVIGETSRRYVIGRGRDVDLVLDDPDASRRHVDVARKGAELVVQDLGSKAGAAIDGSPLGSEDTPWRAGQVLTFGSTSIVFAHPAAEALAELERSPDEPMRPGEEPVMPGDDADESREDVASDSPPPPEVDPDAEAFSSRPLRGPRAPDRGGWSVTDLAVVALAMGVLALSLAGLFWLLR